MKPLLGNEFVVGATDVSALINRDELAATGRVRRRDPGQGQGQARGADQEGEAEEKGESSGAKVYEDDDGDAFAIEDDVLVVADSRKRLDEALEQRDGDDRLTEEDVRRDRRRAARRRRSCRSAATSSG